ncbi:MAG: hypothetical protein M1838_000974 [Thelocarpon superellum]|nr:MAG: hypothetical protein M1838_000974 [Thelocarpon superellum]
MISDKLYQLCRAEETVSGELAKDPTQAPGAVVKRLYHENISTPNLSESASAGRPSATADDLQRAFECGKWGSTRPSELFLRIYHDALATLEKDSMVGVTSPPLMGGSGVVPLTIISVLPDICRHMSNCIARAEREVFLATNYWQASDASKIITNSLKELSRRAGERGQKVVVKIMYDRGNPKQFLDNHQTVPESEWTGKAVQLPPAKEVPHLDMQVVNYHRPIFGTFHSKFMVVDRKIAILSSNNIQDNDNCEMMTHLEGPIVDSLYDMSLITWHNALTPPLPSHNSPAAAGGISGLVPSSQDQPAETNEPRQGPTVPAQEPLSSTYNEPQSNADSRLVNLQDQTVHSDQPEQPPPASGQLPPHTSSDPHYDVDIAGEVARIQASLRPRDGESKMAAVTRHLNTTLQPNTKGDAPEDPATEEMTPYIPHPAHEPVPMAMVNRKPWGAANHSCVHTPQNEAFLSAIRNATKSVFIQTPNLNAEPLLPALQEACRRGVDVVIYVCLGYNDAGELLPFQGGTNEMVAHGLYKGLAQEDKKHLHYYFYVAKDMTKPIHNKFKKRSCHVKLLIVDEHIGIQGNGNQDTQSWYHSQEVNVMIDSPSICASWIQALRRNQNTHLYGALDPKDGMWRDHEGKEAEGAIGIDPGRFAWAKGFVGAVQRVRGAGGF